jgi:isoleucyl-tRNA synthetase
MEHYDLPGATKPILPFIEDASNWYVRRSRRRFWKSGDDADKQAAYQTLHYVLVQLSHVIAPFTPFLAEELYMKLTGGESVHLRDWPEVGHVNELSLQRMAYIREVINEGLSQRAAAGIRVRQPLQELVIWGLPQFFEEFDQEYVTILRDELNVKAIRTQPHSKSHRVTLNTELTPALKREGLMREVVRNVQNARKKADLQVDDRISLVLSTHDKELEKAMHEHLETIKHETLATHLTKEGGGDFKTTAKVDGADLLIRLSKAQ